MVTTATLIAVEIVRKNPDQVGFAVNPRRWVVERFFAWIGRNGGWRRTSKHHRLRTRLPLRRIRHVARASDR
jgi:transposase